MKILVSPEEVERVAQVFLSKSGETETMRQTISAAVEELRSHWQSVTGNRFYDDYVNWEQTMRQYVTLLDDIHKQLLGHAARFRAADEQA